jgi:hypothetical protein
MTASKEGNPIRVFSIGMMVAAGLAMAVPASAEEVYVGGRAGGVGVDVDSGYHRDRDWRRDHYRTEGFERREGFARREGFERCRTIIIREHGMVRKIRRCRD